MAGTSEEPKHAEHRRWLLFLESGFYCQVNPLSFKTLISLDGQFFCGWFQGEVDEFVGRELICCNLLTGPASWLVSIL